MGTTARQIGQLADAFRPVGPFRPLDKQHRFLRLPVAFVSAKGTDSRTNVYGDSLWHGIYDASYTRAGDYLVMASAIYFVASQIPLLPVLCVRTNRTISILQPRMQTSTAANQYGGYVSSGSTSLMEHWPAAVLGESKSSANTVGLPTDQVTPYWNIFVPSPEGVVLSPGDIVTDDLDRTAVIVSSELTNLGWRINARMATT